MSAERLTQPICTHTGVSGDQSCIVGTHYLYNIMLMEIVCCHVRIQATYIKENHYVLLKGRGAVTQMFLHSNSITVVFPLK